MYMECSQTAITHLTNVDVRRTYSVRATRPSGDSPRVESIYTYIQHSGGIYIWSGLGVRVVKWINASQRCVSYPYLDYSELELLCLPALPRLINPWSGCLRKQARPKCRRYRPPVHGKAELSSFGNDAYLYCHKSKFGKYWVQPIRGVHANLHIHFITIGTIAKAKDQSAIRRRRRYESWACRDVILNCCEPS